MAVMCTIIVEVGKMVTMRFPVVHVHVLGHHTTRPASYAPAEIQPLDVVLLNLGKAYSCMLVVREIQPSGAMPFGVGMGHSATLAMNQIQPLDALSCSVDKARS